MELFRIGDTDLTTHILVPTYKVNRQDNYNEWVDGNGKTHHDIYRTSVSGTFTLKFTEHEKYFEFLELLKTHTGAGGYTPVSVYVNNKNEVANINAFIDIKPANTLPLYGVGEYEGFEVNIEEQ